MAITHNTFEFIPKVLDAGILRTLEDNLIMKQIAKIATDRVGKGKGDTLKFSGLADATIGTSSSSFTYEELEDASLELKIDSEAMFSFKVNDPDALMANADIKGSQLDRIAYQLKDKIEKVVFQNIASAIGTANKVTDAGCDPATIIGDISRAEVILAENNVRNNKFLIIPPWVRSYLTLAGIKFAINEGINGKGVMQYANALGFDIFETNALYNAAATPQTYCYAGSYNAIGYADVQYATRVLELEGKRAIGLDGGFAYGYKVVRPKELVLLDLTYAAYTGM